MIGTWRQHSAPIIADVIKANPTATEKEMRKLISAEYPYGQRANHPYKVWCDEVNKQVKAKFPPPQESLDALPLFESCRTTDPQTGANVDQRPRNGVRTED
jgi:hypothetical protein